MPDTAIDPIPKQGKFRRALAAVRRIRHRQRHDRNLEEIRSVRLRFTRRARRHLDAISEYITERNPDAARSVGARIRETICLLAVFPHMGHEGALPGTHEIKAVTGSSSFAVGRVA
jgi:plasmid stabilization system protein ParE